ncbi:MAG TPA: 50S ribosomal protein L11 methyltransferase [Polyangiaceae bacterium]
MTDAGARPPGDAAETPVPSYPYVVVDVSEETADEASAALFALGAGGVEERDATTMARGAATGVTLIGSFEREEDALAAAAELPASWSPRVERVLGDAWRDEWKKHFEPFRIAGDIVVCPPWRQYERSGGDRVIVLEPGRAFGTGLHETTSLVAQALVDHAAELRGTEVLDVGCGSGILSLVALTLGARAARAVDTDEEAVLVTRENAERNGLGGSLIAEVGTADPRSGRYPVVVANIESQPLVELAPSLTSCVARGGILILSGILAPHVAPRQIADIRVAYGALREEELHSRGEWIAVVLRA